MSRAIVRYSLQGRSSRTRNKIDQRLANHGFKWDGTATAEARAITKLSAIEAVESLLEVLKAPGAAELDHFWLYIDASSRPEDIHEDLEPEGDLSTD